MQITRDPLREMNEIHHDRLCEQVAKRLQDMIVNSQLQPGDRLPPENQLTSSFGVSRTTIREAVKLLKERGLVSVVHGKGVFVTQPGLETVSASMGLLFQMSCDSVEHTYEIRRALELAIAPLAAERATASDVAKLAVAIDKMEQSLDNAEGYVEGDMEFHLTLAAATQNPLFLALITPVIDVLTRDRMSIFRTPGAPVRGQVGHKKILKHITERDPEKARQAMLDHLTQAEADGRVSQAPLAQASSGQD